MSSDRAFVNVDAVESVADVSLATLTFVTAGRVDTLGQNGAVVDALFAFIDVKTFTSISAISRLTFAVVGFVTVNAIAANFGTVVQAKFALVNVGTRFPVSAQSFSANAGKFARQILAFRVKRTIVSSDGTFVDVDTCFAIALVSGLTFTFKASILR